MNEARSGRVVSVNVNEGYRGSFGSVDAPMGGLKQSGIGRRNGREGLLRFVDPVTVSVKSRLQPPAFPVAVGVLRAVGRA